MFNAKGLSVNIVKNKQTNKQITSFFRNILLLNADAYLQAILSIITFDQTLQ